QDGKRAVVLNDAETVVAEDGFEEVDGLAPAQRLLALDGDGAVHMDAGPEINDKSRGATQVTQDVIKLRVAKIHANARARREIGVNIRGSILRRQVPAQN